MRTTGFIALRGRHSFHMLECRTIKEVEVGERSTRIVTPYHTLEVENIYNRLAIRSLCDDLQTGIHEGSLRTSEFYPRLNDLPF